MTAKRKMILNSALQLFASKGFDAVPTSLIAKNAAVSEGLIFRHYKNKQGLLTAIMEVGREKVNEGMEDILALEKPEDRITAIMEVPFHMEEEDYPFWKLMYSMKWNNEVYDDEMSKPIKGALIDALTEMKYLDPVGEADLIMAYMDGFVTTVILKKDVVDKERLLNTLRKKYK